MFAAKRLLSGVEHARFAPNRELGRPFAQDYFDAVGVAAAAAEHIVRDRHFNAAVAIQIRERDGVREEDGMR